MFFSHNIVFEIQFSPHDGCEIDTFLKTVDKVHKNDDGTYLVWVMVDECEYGVDPEKHLVKHAKSFSKLENRWRKDISQFGTVLKVVKQVYKIGELNGKTV